MGAKTGAVRGRTAGTAISAAGRNPARAQAGNDTAKDKDTPAAPAQRHLLILGNRFMAVLDNCVAHTDVETVHRVRTDSRRVQATIEMILREAGRGSRSFEKAGKEWLRLVKSARRAAGPVRDLDVHRKLLKKSTKDWQETAKPAEQSPTHPRSDAGEHQPDREGTRLAAAEATLLNSQSKKLDQWLKGERNARARNLRKKIKQIREKLAVRQAVFLAAMRDVAGRDGKQLRAPELVALNNFVRAVDVMPSLDSSNLHDFRKLTKKARYVAELAPESESARSLARALKHLQDSIGTWHDWLSLRQEAKAALGADGLDLASWLGGQEEHFLIEALETAERIRGQLLGEWMSLQGSKRRYQRGKPVLRAARAYAVSRQPSIRGAA